MSGFATAAAMRSRFKKKMAQGGDVEDPITNMGSAPSMPASKSIDINADTPSADSSKKSGGGGGGAGLLALLAHGGEVAKMIMKAKASKMMANGGEIDADDIEGHSDVRGFEDGRMYADGGDVETVSGYNADVLPDETMAEKAARHVRPPAPPATITPDSAAMAAKIKQRMGARPPNSAANNASTDASILPENQRATESKRGQVQSYAKGGEVAEAIRMRRIAKAQAAEDTRSGDVKEQSRSRDFYAGLANDGEDHAEIGTHADIFAEEHEKALRKMLPVGSPSSTQRVKPVQTYSSIEDENGHEVLPEVRLASGGEAGAIDDEEAIEAPEERKQKRGKMMGAILASIHNRR